MAPTPGAKGVMSPEGRPRLMSLPAASVGVRSRSRCAPKLRARHRIVSVLTDTVVEPAPSGPTRAARPASPGRTMASVPPMTPTRDDTGTTAAPCAAGPAGEDAGGVTEKTSRAGRRTVWVLVPAGSVPSTGTTPPKRATAAMPGDPSRVARATAGGGADENGSRSLRRTRWVTPAAPSAAASEGEGLPCDSTSWTPSSQRVAPGAPSGTALRTRPGRSAPAPAGARRAGGPRCTRRSSTPDTSSARSPSGRTAARYAALVPTSRDLGEGSRPGRGAVDGGGTTTASGTSDRGRRRDRRAVVGARPPRRGRRGPAMDASGPAQRGASSRPRRDAHAERAAGPAGRTCARCAAARAARRAAPAPAGEGRAGRSRVAEPHAQGTHEQGPPEPPALRRPRARARRRRSAPAPSSPAPQPR